MDLVKELNKNQVVLLVVPPEKYNRIVVDTTKKLSKSNVVYVTLNKTFNSLRESFKKSKVNMSRVLFLDAISKTITEVPNQVDNCYYVSSPGSLTEMSLVIDKFLHHNFDYLIFDSLTNLTVYEKKNPVVRFVSSVINKVHEGKTRVVFLAVKSSENEALIQEVSPFVDKVIKV
jgi:KaiC/GvpD/RAD55 family RecA-like ATPase